MLELRERSEGSCPLVYVPTECSALRLISACKVYARQAARRAPYGLKHVVSKLNEVDIPAILAQDATSFPVTIPQELRFVEVTRLT